MAGAMSVTIYLNIGFNNAHNLCHYVACAPWRASYIYIRFVAVNLTCRSWFVQCFVVTADNGRLMHLTHHPGIEVSIPEWHESVGCMR